jgi:hypothetical protein
MNQNYFFRKEKQNFPDESELFFSGKKNRINFRMNQNYFFSGKKNQNFPERKSELISG